MARHSKTQARRSGNQGMPGWAWLLIGLLLGALAFAAVFLRDKWSMPANLLPQPNPQAQAPAPKDDDAVVAEPVEKPKPKYDFYTLLPEKEVVIPDAELDAQARAEARNAKPKPAETAPAPATNTTSDTASTSPASAPAQIVADNARYLIQAGAFRGSEEAESLKARIALTGEIARVEPASINGTTVYRVRMGPYPNASALAAAKQALANHGITAQAIRVK